MSAARERSAAIRASILEATPSETPSAWKVEGSRGIVTAAGGLSLLVNAWLLCSRLATLGCRLPVEVFHLASEPVPAAVRAAFPPNVRFRSLADITPGFAIKAMALWTSEFDRCLWLDADNLPLRDPTVLLDGDGAALFWPDCSVYSDPDFLAGFGATLSDRELESGQMVVPTRRPGSARALWYVRQLNERHRADTYRYLFGDKDTWRVGWALAGEHAEVAPALPWVIGHVAFEQSLFPFRARLKLRVPGGAPTPVGLVQLGVDREPLFLHRTVREWSLFDDDDRLTWVQPIDETIAPHGWTPPDPRPVPLQVLEAVAWARGSLGQIEWFLDAFPMSFASRLWMRKRFRVERRIATLSSRFGSFLRKEA
jgi:hypothetical protein